MIPKSTVSFALGAVEQSTGKKHLRAGDLYEARNVRSVKAGEIRKRPGFDRASPTADSGSFTSNAESLTSDGLALISRDGADKHWVENLTGNTRAGKGTQKRALPRSHPAPLVAGPTKPVTVAAGGFLWVFVTQTNAYSWHIVDPTNGTMVKDPAVVTATGVTQMAVTQDGTSVWLLYCTGASNTVIAHEYSIAVPTTAVGITTYQTLTNDVRCVDATRLANGDIAVVATQYDAGGNSRITQSYLDTATGQADAAPAAVTTTIATVGPYNNSSECCPSILQGQAGGANWYFVTWRGSGTNRVLDLVEVNFSTLAVASTVTLATVANDGTAARPVIGWCCGYLAGNGDRVVYATSDQYTAAADNNLRSYVLTKYVRAGATTTTVIRNYSYPLSKPFQIGSAWYLATGFDDSKSVDLQRSYWIIDSDGKIVTQFDSPGSGLGAGQKDARTDSPQDGFVTGSWVSGSEARIVVLTDVGGGTTTDFAPTLFRFDFAAAWGAPVRWADGKIVVPGGIPTRVGSADTSRELTPLLFPMPVTFTAGGGGALGGITSVQVIFRLYDSNGDLYRSSPCAIQTQTFNTTGRAVIVKPLTHLLDGTTAQIEVYLSVVGQTTPFLHAVATNDPTVLTQSITVVPDAATIGTEIIYTLGGALSNAPAPPSRTVGYWRDRVLLGSGANLWVSHELSAGFGPRYNEVMVTMWRDGSGDIIGQTPIDYDSYALLKTDRVGTISGGGPDGRGSGNYIVKTLRTQKGLINPKSVASGPQGAYFQSLSDGRVYCVTPALEVTDVAAGIEDYRTETIGAVVWVEAERQLRFYTSGPKVLILEYAKPSDTQPQGRWHYWSSSNLLQAYGASVAPDGAVYHIEAAGTLRKPGTGWQDAGSGSAVDVLVKLVTGDLAAAGQLGASYALSAVRMLVDFVGACTIQMSVTDGTTTDTRAAKSISTAAASLYMRPTVFLRTSHTRVTIEETVGSTEGLVFNGLALVVQPRNQILPPSAAERI